MCGLWRLRREGLSGSFHRLLLDMDRDLPLASEAEPEATWIRSAGCHVLPLKEGVLGEVPTGLLGPSSLGDAEISRTVVRTFCILSARSLDPRNCRRTSTASSSDPCWSLVTKSLYSVTLSSSFWFSIRRFAIRRRSSVSNLHSVLFLMHCEQLGSFPSHLVRPN